LRPAHLQGGPSSEQLKDVVLLFGDERRSRHFYSGRLCGKAINNIGGNVFNIRVASSIHLVAVLLLLIFELLSRCVIKDEKIMAN